MLKTRFKGTIILVCTLLITPIVCQESARAIMQKVYTKQRLLGSQSKTTLIIMDKKGNKRERQFISASLYDSVNNIEKRILKFLAPADIKGTGFLIYDYDTKEDNLWIYLPAVGKTRRIASTESNNSFMGSEFRNSDLVIPSLDDYTYTLKDPEICFNEQCHQIEIVPVSDKIRTNTGYGKKISLVSKSTYNIRKTHFFSLDGALEKTLETNKHACIDSVKDIWWSHELVMYNNKTLRKTIMHIDTIIHDPLIKEDRFTVTYLERD